MTKESDERIAKLQQQISYLKADIIAIKEGKLDIDLMSEPEWADVENADLLAVKLATGDTPEQIAKDCGWRRQTLYDALAVLAKRANDMIQIDGHTALTQFSGAVQNKMLALRKIQRNYESGQHESISLTETYALQSLDINNPQPIDPDKPTSRVVKKDSPSHNGVSTSEYLKSIQQEADLVAKYIEVGQKLGVIQQVRDREDQKPINATQVNIEIVMGDLIREATRKQDTVILNKIANGAIGPDEAAKCLDDLKSK